MSDKPRNSETIIIGGGLVGSALAWGMAREGQSVTVLDEGDIALRASRGNFGLVWVQSKGDGMHDYARWTRRSADLWTDFSKMLEEETGIAQQYEKPGGFQFLLSEAELEAKRAHMHRMHNSNGAMGYGVEIIDRPQLDKIVTGLGPEVTGASYCPHDGHTNPLRLLRAFHAGMAKKGVSYIADAKAETITRDGSGYAVQTAKGIFRADKLVLASGHGNKWLAPSVGMDIPLIPEKGQIIVTERINSKLPILTHLIRQTGDGTIMIGDSHENSGYSTASKTRELTRIARDAMRVLPALAQARIIRTWGAVRVLSPDGFPIYEESETHPGVFSINCHSGVTLAAAHALELAPMLARGKLEAPLEVFTSRRFAGHDISKIAAH